MICEPCKRGQHCMKSNCTCQHKSDRPWTAKYDIPRSDLEIEEVPSDA